MADKKEKVPEHLRDVSKMTAEERYHHIQDSHKLRQVHESPHDLRARDISTQTGKL